MTKEEGRERERCLGVIGGGGGGLSSRGDKNRGTSMEILIQGACY